VFNLYKSIKDNSHMSIRKPLVNKNINSNIDEILNFSFDKNT